MLGPRLPSLRRLALAQQLLPSSLALVHTTATSPTESLFHLEVGGEGSAIRPSTLCVIHGMLGAGKNLQTFAKALCERAEDLGAIWRAVLVDQRNHGRSARLHLPPPHTLQASAHDVIRLFSSWGVSPEVIVGHSMGGKTTLEIVRQLAAAPGRLELPKQVWVLDARPGLVDPSSGTVRDVGRVLHAVQHVPLPVPSRKWLADHLRQEGFSPGLVQWLGSNLHFEAKDRYCWTFNVEGTLEMFDSYCRTDYFPLLRHPPPGVTINIVRAAKSDRWDQAAVQAMQEAVAATAGPSPDRGTTRFWELPDAGHWVHVDNPEGLVEMILPSLLDPSNP